jgi:hypothetical protein
MRRSAVDVEVVLLDILAVIALAVGEPEQTFLQDRVPLVPQGKAQPLLVVADSCQSIFTPVVSPRTGLIVGEIVPRVAVVAVILTNCAPLPFTEVRSPFFPRDASVARVVQPLLFSNGRDVFGGYGVLLALENQN